MCLDAALDNRDESVELDIGLTSGTASSVDDDDDVDDADGFDDLDFDDALWLLLLTALRSLLPLAACCCSASLVLLDSPSPSWNPVVG